ncbi:Vps54-domain-containing protein [Saitoella complicata NRRL Y-17804]|nr:Vps54-domain-containing protein [Saitoella complicata NRRL Y-17804]ODQ54159.1 Vps54-domain-containing protein [Saitoella complicata NRRL Y-17804]
MEELRLQTSTLAKESDGESDSSVIGQLESRFAAAQLHPGKTIAGARLPLRRTGSFASVSSLDLPLSPTESEHGRPSRRHTVPGITPLSTVPPIFFEDNFSLENPRTFDMVSENSDVIRSTASAPESRKALATNAILQEKLSWYMDTVEVHLIKEISTASGSFFSALSDLQVLHNESEGAVEKIRGLREELREVDEEQAVRGLEIERLRVRRANVARLEGAMRALRDVVQRIENVGALIDKDQHAQALEEIEKLNSELAGKSQKTDAAPTLQLDLSKVQALDGARSQLKQLSSRIGKNIEKELARIFVTDLRQWAESISPRETLDRLSFSYQRNLRKPGNGSQRTSMEQARTFETIRPEIERTLEILQQTKSMEGAFQSLRDAVMKEIKAIIKQNLPSDDDAESVSSNITARSTNDKTIALARSLRNMSPVEFREMLACIYTSTVEYLRRLSSQYKLLLDITSTMDIGRSPPPVNGNGNSDTNDDIRARQVMDINDLIVAAVDVAQSRMVRILNVRSEQNSRFSVYDFLQYFALNILFIAECEAISGRMGTGLQGSVSSQAKAFVAVVHSDRMARQAGTVERDQWSLEEVPASVQQSVNRIVAAMTKDSEEWLNDLRVGAEPPKTKTNGDEGRSRSLDIEDQSFYVPVSTIVLMDALEVYEKLLVAIPVLGIDIVANMLDILKLFNSRTCQVILGAGATKSAGLKNITAKHLAMASQSLSVVITLMPYLRECARRHIGQAPIIAEFDKVKRAYQEHQNEIHSKLVAIMSDRLESHCRSLATINWERANTEKPEAYMEALVKETTTLHKVLAKYLNNIGLQTILDEVHARYNSRLGEEYRRIELRSVQAQEAMLADVRYFQDRLSKLEGVRGPGDYLAKLVEGKAVSAA